MKKTLAILMSVVMVLSVFAMAVSAEETDWNSVFYHPIEFDFESGSFDIGPMTGDPAGTGISIGELIQHGGKAEIKDLGGEHGKVWVLSSPGEGKLGRVGIYAKSRKLDWNMSELGRKVTFSADLNISAVSGANEDDYNLHIVPVLAGADPGNFVVFGNGFGGKGTVWCKDDAKAEAFTPGKWFRLDIEMDFDGNTLKAYINDKLAVSQSIVDGSSENVNLGAGVMFQWKNGPAGREVMIDNIKYTNSIKDRTNEGGDNNPDPPAPPTSDFAYAVAVVAVVSLVSLAGVVVAKKKSV